jgi:type III pantothenate kinase
VVDFSTATSFDVIGAGGEYVGSVIAPGLALAADALFEHTSRLPRVDLQRPRMTVGKDTTTALQSGLVLGHIAMVEGLLERIKAETHRDATVIATGELAPSFVHAIPAIHHVEPHLTLIGLRLLYELNHE